MSASGDFVDNTRANSPVHHSKRKNMESSRSPRSSKQHHSRSRSRSRDRKRNRKHRRSRSRSTEARKREPEKPSKSHKQADEHHHERLSAEDGDKRSRRKDRKSSRGRSSSRSHSRERRHHSRSRDRRRSSRSHSRDRKRRPRSRSRSRSKQRYRSGSRSRSREQRKKSEKVRKRSRSGSANPPIFRGRNTAMDAQEALARRLERAKKLQEQKELSEKHQQEVIEATSPVAIAATPTTVSAVAAASNHALNVAALLASGTQVTPQIAMAAQMAALQARALAEGVAVPGYYNPSAVNPCKFADQEKKRKKLWQGKKDGDKSQTAELWENLNFGNKDQNVKFRKLMGIKGDEEGEASRPLNDEGLKTLQKQEEVFRNLDVQYEMARSQTHTQRGMGLGFSSAFSRGMDSF
ncbi:arginine/serine-rich coiled-coil protein 2 isoform X1 [Syngnathus typhle]|uniref:arginine/serine-rich coiled-coil protein 2 isoform X1 n=1 Tax=Syngnathus typhle TaxID=161592 RepID=UPI002A6B40DE|nr:arginine/serine-rich coiled-coil protein 2 isoform X1 [Syngnathus typhle]